MLFESLDLRLLMCSLQEILMSTMTPRNIISSTRSIFYTFYLQFYMVYNFDISKYNSFCFICNLLFPDCF